MFWVDIVEYRLIKVYYDCQTVQKYKDYICPASSPKLGCMGQIEYESFVQGCTSSDSTAGKEFYLSSGIIFMALLDAFLCFVIYKITLSQEA